MENLEEVFKDTAATKKIMLPYKAAINIIKTKLEVLDEEMRCSIEHDPIHDIKSRIKSPASILEKLARKKQSKTLSSLYTLHDIAGLRVICHYVNDIHYVAQLLVLHEDTSLIEKRNYIQYPKANGYRSLHLIVKVPVYQKDGVIEVPVEIQIRTIAMDCWASLEHELQYKGMCKVSDDTYNRLKQCAKNMEQTDFEMQKIYQELNSQWSKI